ncbi:hypothetical protein LX36DRAFT_653188 [Colletotrichum falcatum]|nr:hypothetical protein LX36DRAFT_653188 [Colletotrichum falcatum]
MPLNEDYAFHALYANRSGWPMHRESILGVDAPLPVGSRPIYGYVEPLSSRLFPSHMDIMHLFLRLASRHLHASIPDTRIYPLPTPSHALNLSQPLSLGAAVAMPDADQGSLASPMPPCHRHHLNLDLRAIPVYRHLPTACNPHASPFSHSRATVWISRDMGLTQAACLPTVSVCQVAMRPVVTAHLECSSQLLGVSSFALHINLSPLS